ncbi:hypothetical protein [Streptomyces prunicolor]|uniref:hypothetical protein n=1 Tax=Streptomyces prunicolor TaxID=67348 RepID=UPI00341C5F7A
MIANVFTVTDLGPADLRRALAALLGVTAEAVDVADRDGDQETRRWDAPVLCTYRVLPLGDLALELDLSVEDGTAGTRTEADLAHGLAVRTATSVLYPAQDLGLDSAYWVAAPDGRAVRCRLETIDSDEDTTYRIDAVEEPVTDLPHATVEYLTEALDGEPIQTPVADAFLSTYPTGTTASVEGRVHYNLRVWERLVRRLAADWSPSGRYREDLFLRDLQARDDLAGLVTEVDTEHTDPLREALTRLDDEFRNRTEQPDDHPAPERWWRNRTPRTIPW